ncbi:uncharacterized protein APUU_21540A [Aspergillus puulaauensis]|uniref:RZ-type domain-containing protein n=1 Tax=Aspergillus puulaauensis TaxID=1220207 RepID=A0A7R7XHK8_9EURO|nr:uncharacterized protein APUU_21540A [Aspergillus puulaauensis]BCS21108.1 hypothetical protein APUU_21540A [Aspergillus puulaauensis]
MDGVMAIKYHYEIEPTTEELIRPKLSWRAMTSSAAPTCPECRGSLRDIHRYNRITKKALLDESTRRFVVMANRDYVDILRTVQLHEEALDEHGSKLAEWLANNPFDSMVPAQVQQTIDTYSSTDGRMRNRVQKFLKRVRTTEQPLGRVNELLASAAARTGVVGGNEHTTEHIGILTGFSIRGECLHLRLTWVILWETERICKNPAVPFDTCSVLRGKVRNQLPELLEKCHAVRGQSSDGKFLAERVQATLYQVLVSQLFLNCIATEAQAPRIPPALLPRNKIKESLQECEGLYLSHLGTLGHLKDDIAKTKRFCDGQPFYTSVTAEERREVYEAMAVQFQGTGHWYYCRNNHPFTVGECGMPMEEARCPQCGERVGGHDHEPVAGVQRAQDMEAEFGTA